MKKHTHFVCPKPLIRLDNAKTRRWKKQNKTKSKNQSSFSGHEIYIQTKAQNKKCRMNELGIAGYYRY